MSNVIFLSSESRSAHVTNDNAQMTFDITCILQIIEDSSPDSTLRSVSASELLITQVRLFQEVYNLGDEPPQTISGRLALNPEVPGALSRLTEVEVSSLVSGASLPCKHKLEPKTRSGCGH